MDMNTWNQKRGWTGLLSLLFVSLTACMFTACDDEIDVQRTFPFTVETMPVPTRLMMGETAEIRCELKREGRFEDARYTIRYFQPDGEGSLLLDNGMKLLPNDRYPLDREVFRLYYTSACEDRQTIDIYFEDNAGQVVLLAFSFNNENENKEEDSEAGEDTGGLQVEETAIPSLRIDTVRVRFPLDLPVKRPFTPQEAVIGS